MALKEMLFENVETTTTDGRRMHAYTISSPIYEPLAQVS